MEHVQVIPQEVAFTHTETLQSPEPIHDGVKQLQTLFEDANYQTLFPETRAAAFPETQRIVNISAQEVALQDYGHSTVQEAKAAHGTQPWKELIKNNYLTKAWNRLTQRGTHDVAPQDTPDYEFQTIIHDEMSSLENMKLDLDSRIQENGEGLAQLSEAMDAWTTWYDAKGELGKKGTTLNSGIGHYFNPAKAERFPEPSIDDFIHKTKAWEEAVNKPFSEEDTAKEKQPRKWASVYKRENGDERRYVWKDGWLIVAHRKADDPKAQIITAYPCPEKRFVSALSSELTKYKKRSHPLKSQYAEVFDDTGDAAYVFSSNLFPKEPAKVANANLK